MKVSGPIRASPHVGRYLPRRRTDFVNEQLEVDFARDQPDCRSA